MFWKAEISGVERDMMELCRALSDFFEYAAGQPGGCLDEDAFRRSRPLSAAWLLEQWTSGSANSQKLRQAVEKLFRLSTARRRAVADAVAHDVEFYRAGSGAGFTFQTLALSKEERNVVHDFFLYFNDVALGRRVGPTLNGHISRATRGDLSADYYRTNPVLRRVCPVCLHQKSNGIKENDLDHYFPKARYPVLAVHPWNLMYICKECNQIYKGEKIPLPRAGDTLDKAFRPYRDTVREHTELKFQWEPGEEEDRVKLRPAGGGAGEKGRIDQFNRLFRLEERWSADLERIFGRLHRHYAGKDLDKAALRRELEEQCRELRELADPDFPEEFLEAEYAAWLCEEQLDAFYESLHGRDACGPPPY